MERPIEAAEVVDGIRVRVDEHMSSMGKWEIIPLANRVALSNIQYE